MFNCDDSTSKYALLATKSSICPNLARSLSDEIAQ